MTIRLKSTHAHIAFPHRNTSRLALATSEGPSGPRNSQPYADVPSDIQEAGGLGLVLLQSQQAVTQHDSRDGVWLARWYRKACKVFAFDLVKTADSCVPASSGLLPPTACRLFEGRFRLASRILLAAFFRSATMDRLYVVSCSSSHFASFLLLSGVRSTQAANAGVPLVPASCSWPSFHTRSKRCRSFVFSSSCCVRRCFRRCFWVTSLTRLWSSRTDNGSSGSRDRFSDRFGFVEGSESFMSESVRNTSCRAYRALTDCRLYLVVVDLRDCRTMTPSRLAFQGVD